MPGGRLEYVHRALGYSATLIHTQQRSTLLFAATYWHKERYFARISRTLWAHHEQARRLYVARQRHQSRKWRIHAKWGFAVWCCCRRRIGERWRVSANWIRTIGFDTLILECDCLNTARASDKIENIPAFLDITDVNHPFWSSLSNKLPHLLLIFYVRAGILVSWLNSLLTNFWEVINRGYYCVAWTLDSEVRIDGK